jgi:competence ComEA-like helix-hairpin-helix protein
MVRGVTRDLLFDQDTHENGLLPPAGDGEDDSLSGDNLFSDTDGGWAGIVTVHSTDKNITAGGQDRVNVQTADETALTGIHGITPAIARAIVSYRGQNQFQSIADLLDVTAPNNQNQNPGGNANSGSNSDQDNSNQSSGAQNTSNSSTSNPGPANSGSGQKVIDQDLLIDIADAVSTTDSGQDLSGIININTASLNVLTCLPGVDRQLAQAIISYRQSSGFFANTAELLRVEGITLTLFKQIAPLISARSETYRILSEGEVKSTHARQRIQAIVHIGLSAVSTLSYREDDL